MVARYLQYVRSASDLNLNLDIEWLHMAATLIQWKSRALLKQSGGKAAADPLRDELIQQLMAHRKEAAEKLADRRETEAQRFTKASDEELRQTEYPADAPHHLSVWDLIQQAWDLARWVDQHREDRRYWDKTLSVEKDDATVEDMMAYLRAHFPRAGTLSAVSLIEQQTTPARRSCLFLGMLEMVRSQELKIHQTEPFGPVFLEARPL
jgi:chromatin segregation and condensation protein Rec8/ScpA/Scc1 (kleisin family)